MLTNSRYLRSNYSVSIVCLMHLPLVYALPNPNHTSFLAPIVYSS